MDPTTKVSRSARSLLAAAARHLPMLAKRYGSTVRRADQHLDQVSLYFKNQPLELLVRRGTTDVDLVNMVLREKVMYRLPETVEPKVIFDIGANIGITAVYFALLYPDAQVYCFEPLPENLQLLRRNTRCVADRVHILPYGLSDKSGRFDYYMSDNPLSYGGGSFLPIGHDPARSLELALKDATEALEELGVDRVDLVKIDTEGSELAVVKSLPHAVRTAVQAFVGELHGVGDWQVCDLLAQSHRVGVDKPFGSRCFPFIAVRQDLV